MGEISVGELRDVEKLYHLEDESGITQKELAGLEIGKSRQRRKSETSTNTRIGRKEKKELNSRIKKLKRNRKELFGRINNRPIGNTGHG